MPLVSSTSSNVALGVNFQMMKGLLLAARKKLPFFNGTLPGTLQKNGSTASVKWERLENLNAVTTALAEVDGNQSAFFGRSTVLPSVSTVTAAMAKYGNAVLLTEEIDLQQMNLRAARFLDMLGANAGESLNRLMYDVYNAATLIRYSNGLAGGAAADTAVSAAISLTDIKYAVNTLNRNSALSFTTPAYGSQNIGTSPIRSSFYGICHPDVEEDIRGLTGFVSVEQYGGYTDTLPFEFGAVGGVRWSSTEIIPVSSAAGVTTGSAASMRAAQGTAIDVYSSFIYGQEAIGTVGLGNTHATNQYQMYDPKNPPAVEIINKPMGTVGTDLYNEVQSLAWKAWFVGKILNSNWVVKVRSASAKV